MSLLVDEKYLLLLSPKLERFVKKGDHLYNCRCPICGDSEKSKLKSRGYFFAKGDALFYKCHNCSFSSRFSYLLSQIDVSLHHQYGFEIFQPSQIVKCEEKAESIYKSFDLPRLSDVTNRVSDYALSRGFQKEQMDRVYYVENFRDWAVYSFGEKYIKVAKDERLVLPFFDVHGNLVGGQGRSIDPNTKFRYETVKHPDVNHAIFGLDHWNRTKRTYVTEGPIDSLFLPNAISPASSDLKRVLKILPESEFIFIWDNEPRSREITKLMLSSIESGLKVFIWPSNVTCKDINDAIKSDIDIHSLVKENIYDGISAKLRFVQWCKV